MTGGQAPPRAGRREWVGLAVLALPTFVVAIDLFVLMTALPSVATDLGASSTQQLWIMDIYGFMLAGFLVTMGTLGDRIGRRKLLLTGAVAFAAASLLAAYSTTPEMLIAARALLGVAGATLGPSTLSLIPALFADPRQQATAFGVWGGTFTLGALFGPVIGGAMLTGWWWGSVFLLGVPVMLLAAIVGPKVLPEVRNAEAGKLDPLSIVLSLAALLPIVYGIKEITNGVSVPAIAGLVVGLVFGVVFARRQGRLASPLLDLSLFRHKVIRTCLTGQLAYALVGGGLMLFMMLYFQLSAGLSTLEAGLAMVPGMAAATIGMQVGPKLAARVRPGYVIATGLVGMAAVLLVLTGIGPTGSTATIIVGFAVFSFCGAPLVALGTGMIVGNAPPEKMGMAGSMAQMSNEFGGMLGIAVLGSVGTGVYRATVEDSVPAGLSGASADAVRDSIAGAPTAAGELPEQAGAQLFSSAQSAFVDGFQVLVVTGSVIIAAAAVSVYFGLRHLPPIGRTDEASADSTPESDPELAEAR
ncbi:MFS transporter [Actinophytocola gossypii]|uniref:MFS transporter n=1 Tax=Actinophytocola gossypii TaxID=2812003 RepID=A0ABT2JG23_9PSEU|nr:MFS transporter [Actinophytocola gossypii]MCT2586822.1 MFS transporter [Actinophytocola gossypii]